MRKFRISIIASHLIQYQAPLFKKLAEQKEIDLTAYFCWDFGIKEAQLDQEFGVKIKWDTPLLEGYNYKFLKNFSFQPSSGFWGQINPGVIIELAKNRPDAIMVFGWNSFTNWLVFLTAFIFKIPIFLRGENPLNQELLKQKWKITIKKVILGRLFKRISVFLYIGEENKKFYEFYGASKEKLFFTPYAVDNERYIKASQKFKNRNYELRKELGINKNNVVIFFVGKLIEKKRPMDLLKAYELATKSLKALLAGRQVKANSLSLVFVGDGNSRQELGNYAKTRNIEDVHFVGFKNQTELPQYYAMADIFVLPSGVGETWGLVVNEAMCFGLPVIVSDAVGCGMDLAKNAKNGYIFPLGDIEKLSEHLGELTDNSAKRKAFGKKSFEVIQNYSYRKDINGIIGALLSL